MRILAATLALALAFTALPAGALTDAERRAEWDRRNAKYPNAPYYLPPGPVDVYDNKDGKGDPIANIPTGIKFLVLEGQADWYPKIYVPCMDVEGWFNRMQLCAYKGNNVVLDNQELQKLENELFDKSLGGSTTGSSTPTGTSGTTSSGTTGTTAGTTSSGTAGTTTGTATGTTSTSKTPYEPPAWTRADPESVEFKQGMRAERERREKKYQGASESRFPWLDLPIFKDETMKEEVAKIPAGVRCQIISDPAGWNVKLYCPCMDVEGWFDRMILCAFKGSNLTIQLNEVYKLEEKLFMESLGKEPSPDPIGPVVIPGSSSSSSSAPKPPAPTASKPATPVAKPNPSTPAKPTATTSSTKPTSTSSTPASTPSTPVAAEPPKPVEKPIMQATNASGLRVFVRSDKTPNASSPVQLPPGATVDVLRHEGDWCYIRYEGKEGWVRAYYIGLGK